MIGHLSGVVLFSQGNLVTVDVNGVGYEVTVPDSALPKLSNGTKCQLFVRQIVREDSITLCGFLEKSERALFDLLLDVKGCGPKVAQSLIGTLGGNTVVASVLGNDAKTLSRAQGVGVRLAERLILELRSKLESRAGDVTAPGTIPLPSSGNSELVSALTALGFRRPEIDSIVQKIDDSEPLESQIKTALGLLRKGS